MQPRSILGHVERLIAASVFVVLGSTLLNGSSPSPSPTQKVVVSMDHHAHYTASLTLTVDGRAVCQIALAERPTSERREVCAFELPRTAREIGVNGQFTHLRSGEPPTRGSRRARIVDLAPVLSPLRDTSRPFGQRIRAFLQAKAALEKIHPVLMHNVDLEIGEGDPLQAVKAAEARLKFPLPPEHVSFLREIGRITVDESSTVSVGELDRASRQINEIWGMSAAEMKKTMKPATLAFLEASTMLYSTNDHDWGYGGLFYEPALPGRPSACGQQPAYHYINADSMDEPIRTQSEGKECESYTDAMLPLFVADILNGWEEQGVELALIDRSAADTLHLFLRYDPDQDLFPLELHPRWEMFK